MSRSLGIYLTQLHERATENNRFSKIICFSFFWKKAQFMISYDEVFLKNEFIWSKFCCSNTSSKYIDDNL